MLSAIANPRTAVVLKDNASALLPWVNEVPAIFEAWFPGQEDANIVARLLFGIANPVVFRNSAASSKTLAWG